MTYFSSALAGLALAIGSALPPTAVVAQQTSAPAAQELPARVTLGWGGIVSNDYFGDGEDRWRSSSYTASRVRGPKDMDSLPPSFGSLREFRMRVENITPADLAAPAANDRRYAGVLSFGMHSHFRAQSEEISLGADVVIIGPQTGLSRLQSHLHDRLGLPDGAAAYNAQFADDVKLSATGEVGRVIALGGNAHVRPFVEGQIGVETLLRGGVDFTFGDIGRGAVLIRDATTGQRYHAVHPDQSGGVQFVLGGDVARVWNSHFLPESGAATLTQTRNRLRAGVTWQGEKANVFFGVTHLSREFAQQPSGQTLGSLSVLLRF
jgi:hypothetical protein